MYKKGDYVIKIPEGICEIEDVGCLDISGVNKDKEYYALAPINQKGSKIYIPVGNVHGRIRNIISKEDAIAFIKSMPDIDEKDIQNEKMREQEYKAVILSGDNEKIASILKLIYSRKQERAEQGKKLSSTDEKYFKLAEYMLFSELSFVLNVPREHIEQYIADMIEA